MKVMNNLSLCIIETDGVFNTDVTFNNKNSETDYSFAVIIVIVKTYFSLLENIHSKDSTWWCGPIPFSIKVNSESP